MLSMRSMVMLSLGTSLLRTIDWFFCVGLSWPSVIIPCETPCPMNRCPTASCSFDNLNFLFKFAL